MVVYGSVHIQCIGRLRTKTYVYTCKKSGFALVSTTCTNADESGFIYKFSVSEDSIAV